MTLDAFVQMVKSIRYKRGYVLTAHIGWSFGGNVAYLALVAAVPDAGDPDQYVSVTQREMFSAQDIHRCEPEHMLHRIRDFLLAFERHEFGEWFVYDGTKPFDPHKHDGTPQ